MFVGALLLKPCLAATLQHRDVCLLGSLAKDHAVGNYYLKYSWEYFMHKRCVTYSFVVDTPNIWGNFLWLLGHDQLGENDLTYLIWGVLDYFR